MIVVIEGGNGCGKTALAKALSDLLGWPILRPLRTHPGVHMEELEQAYRLMKVPANSHVDDVYAADFLATFNVDAILDRSMPSALAYATEAGADPLWVSGLFKWWHARLAGKPVLYVWLTCSYEVAKARSPDRPMTKASNAKLERAFGTYFVHFPVVPLGIRGFQKMCIDTTEATKDQTLQRVRNALGR